MLKHATLRSGGQTCPTSQDRFSLVPRDQLQFHNKTLEWSSTPGSDERPVGWRRAASVARRRHLELWLALVFPPFLRWAVLSLFAALFLLFAEVAFRGVSTRRRSVMRLKPRMDFSSRVPLQFHQQNGSLDFKVFISCVVNMIKYPYILFKNIYQQWRCLQRRVNILILVYGAKYSGLPFNPPVALWVIHRF